MSTVQKCDIYTYSLVWHETYASFSPQFCLVPRNIGDTRSGYSGSETGQAVFIRTPPHLGEVQHIRRKIIVAGRFDSYNASHYSVAWFGNAVEDTWNLIKGAAIAQSVWRRAISLYSTACSSLLNGRSVRLITYVHREPRSRMLRLYLQSAMLSHVVVLN
jgi:hypothetical protein